MKRRTLALLLTLALALSLCACGDSEGTGFRTLQVLGQRRYCLIFRQGDRIAGPVNAAMADLAEAGTLSNLSRRWLREDLIRFTPPEESTGENEAPASADGETEEPIQTVRTLIVGVEQDFDPIAYVTDGVLRGMSVDIATELGTALGWKVSYQPISAAEVEAQLSSGNIDVALGFDPNTVTEGRYTVGAAYMQSDIILAVRQNGARTLRSLRGERIGTVDDPAVTAAVKGNEAVTKNASGATVYLSARRCITALDNGWCAAIAMDRIMLEHAQ